MQFTLATILALAAAVSAAPAPEAHGRVGWCGIPGQNCGRDVAAVVARNPEAHGRVGWCGIPGQNCMRDLVEVEKRDPEARHGGRVGWCGIPGQNCEKRDITDILQLRHLNAVRNAEAIVARNAEAAANPEARHGGRVGWCGIPGQNCMKRDLQELGILHPDFEDDEE